VAEVVAPPPSPVAYVAMGSVGHDHFLQLEEHLEEEEQHTFAMDDVSSLFCSLLSLLYLCLFTSCCLIYIEARFSGAAENEPDLVPETCYPAGKIIVNLVV
jgi:hypothetical protein